MRAGAHQPTPEPGGSATAGLSASDRSLLEPGRLIGGRYRLAGSAASGGHVWRATARDGANVALKTGDPDRIRREYELVSLLDHPHIVRAVDCVEDGSLRFAVFEYLPGGDLVSLAGAPAAAWLPAIANLIDALDYLHLTGFVHRDLKARNVRFDAADSPRLIDFGSAVPIGSPWTNAGTTPEARPPARPAGPVAPADDTWALAVLLAELLDGAPAGPAETKIGALVDATLCAPGSFDRPTLQDLQAGIKSLLRKPKT